MGKPFVKELDKIYDTLHWGLQQDCESMHSQILENDLQSPLYIVGSGGSLSACYFAALLYQQHGLMAKAVTPLELFYSKDTLRMSSVLFISASGRNNDILFGYKTAVDYEPRALFSLSMKLDTPLAKLSSAYSIGKHFEFKLPAGKDGFLATNSLVAFFSVLYKSLAKDPKSNFISDQQDDYLKELDDFMSRISYDFTFTILYAGWGQPVAMDLESKMAEAALADVLVSDVRNFGHGRHHWFDKRKGKSAIIALITPEEARITEKTLSLLPDDIAILKICSAHTDGYASIEMLMKAFRFISKLGELQNIDPGRPGVPEFGSKLYHLRYSRFYKKDVSKEVMDMQTAILRKTGLPSMDHLDVAGEDFWVSAYRKFKKRFEDISFGSIIFDYDGTLCSAENRCLGIETTTAGYLNEILRNNIVIGIATGRGDSVAQDLRDKIDQKYWGRTYIGYYNCAQIATLEDHSAPRKNLEVNPVLAEVFRKISEYNFPYLIQPELKPSQIVIKTSSKATWRLVRQSIVQFVEALGIPAVQVLESSHSIDIIDRTRSNKMRITDNCINMALQLGAGENFLCIGDKGRWPGNDYQLLSHQYSLSVDEVSALHDSCWNLSANGIKNIDALHQYLSLIEFGAQGFKIRL